jgi:hypothetical protein
VGEHVAPGRRAGLLAVAVVSFACTTPDGSQPRSAPGEVEVIHERADAAALRSRLSIGAVSTERLALASALGHAAARVVVGDRREVVNVIDAAEWLEFGDEAAIRAGIAALRHVLPLHEARHPSDRSARDDVEATERWFIGVRSFERRSRLAGAAVHFALTFAGQAEDAAATGMDDLAARRARIGAKLFRDVLVDNAIPTGLAFPSSDGGPGESGLRDALTEELLAWALGSSDPVRARQGAAAGER